MSEYLLHPEAYADLDAIRAFIAEANPDAADRFINEVFDALQSLDRFPNQGHRRPDLTSCPLRFWPVRDYLLVYAPDERPIWVIAVLHGSRDPRFIAAQLEKRE